MIAQWDSPLSVLPVARVQFPATGEYFKGAAPLLVDFSAVVLTFSLPRPVYKAANMISQG